MFLNILTFLVITWNVKVSYQDVASDAPKINEFIVKTFVANHFAETTVLSEVENDDTYTKQTTFSVVFPEGAFVSGFSMKIDGDIYKSFVKGTEEAEKTYGQPDQTDGYVAVYIRNSNRLTVNVDIEPKSKVHFNLTYEELLQRERGQYEIITNIQPGQVVRKLLVEVEIKDNSPLLFVRTPSLRSGNNALLQNNSQLKPHAMVKISNTSATVKFQPDLQRQLQFACAGLGNMEYEGFAGQFVVQYDIERDAQVGETLFQDGFVISSLAPSNLMPILKHIVFVLDTSGSMRDIYIDQLKKGMISILSQIDSEDLFSIVQYEETVYLWDLNLKSHDVIPFFPEYGNLASQLEITEIPEAFAATPENINIAKKIVNSFNADGGTNTIGALEVGLYLVKLVQKKYQGMHQPILIFLTDGLPSVGVESTSDIISLILNINSKEYYTPIYSLCFGDDAHWNFLQELSLATKAKATRIYVSDDMAKTSDISIQLSNFYETINGPVLNDILFDNLPPSVQMTQLYFPIFTNGSEITIAGKGTLGNNTKPIKVLANSRQGLESLETKIGKPLTQLERVWAYLTIKQLIEESHVTSLQSKIEFEKLAVELSLNYSLVTNVTSLIVVKPNGIHSTMNIVDAAYGILPEPPNSLPMCSNITSWIATNFGILATEDVTTEITTEEATTTSTDATTPATINNVTTITPDDVTTSTTDTITTTTTDATTTSTTDAITTSTTDIITTSTTDDTTTSIDPTATAFTNFATSTSRILTTEKNIDVHKFNLVTEFLRIIPVTTKVPIILRKTKSCRDMIFGCCHDGVTPAVGYNFSGCDPIPRPESCSLPISNGICSKMYWNKRLKWAYSTQLGKCRSFWYNGCGGNDNRFANETVCKRACVTVISPGVSRVQQNKNCEEMKFGCCYDGVTPARGLNYLGCDPIPRPESCSLETNRGIPCRQNYSISTKYTYVTRLGQCRQLHYSGCGGNDNRFASKMDCENVCMKATGRDRCKLPIFFKATKSLCKATPTLWWFYDERENDCIQHLYFGCFGNTNKFLTKKECEDGCVVL